MQEIMLMMKDAHESNLPKQPKPCKPHFICLRPEDEAFLLALSNFGSESVLWDTSKPLPAELRQKLEQLLAKYKDNNTP